MYLFIFQRFIYSRPRAFKYLSNHYRGCIKKCTPFQIQISHNLLNIRCSAVSWPILYLMQTWTMLHLNIFLWVVFLFIQIEVILNSHVQKTLCFHALLIREIIRLSNYYNRLRLIWIWKGVHFLIHPVCSNGRFKRHENPIYAMSHGTMQAVGLNFIKKHHLHSELLLKIVPWDIVLSVFPRLTSL
jgi:hypothetical protein